MRFEIEPQTHWSQDDEFVHLSVWIAAPDEESTSVTISPNSVKIISTPYRLELDLYGEIETEPLTTFEYKRSGIAFSLAKKTHEEWPFLVKPGKRKPLVAPVRPDAEQQARKSAIAADTAREQRRQLEKKAAQDRQLEIENRKRQLISEAKEKELAQQVAELQTFKEDLQAGTISEGRDEDDDEEFHDVGTEIDVPDYFGPTGQAKKQPSPQGSWDEREFQDVISPTTAGRPRSGDTSPVAAGARSSGRISPTTAARLGRDSVPAVTPPPSEHISQVTGGRTGETIPASERISQVTGGRSGSAGRPGSARIPQMGAGPSGSDHISPPSAERAEDANNPPMTAGELGSAQVPPVAAERRGSAGVSPVTSERPGSGRTPQGTPREPASAHISPGSAGKRGNAHDSPVTTERPGSARLPPVTAERPGSGRTPRATSRELASAHISPGSTGKRGNAQDSPVSTERPGSARLPPVTAERPGSGHTPRATSRELASAHISPESAGKPGDAHISPVTAERPGSASFSPLTAERPGSGHAPQVTPGEQASAHISPESAEKPGDAQISPVSAGRPGTGDTSSEGGLSPATASRPGSGHIFTATATEGKSGFTHVFSAQRPSTAPPPRASGGSAQIFPGAVARLGSGNFSPAAAGSRGGAQLAPVVDFLELEAEEEGALLDGDWLDAQADFASDAGTSETETRPAPVSQSTVPPRSRKPPVQVEFTELQTEHLPAREKREEELKTYQRVPLAEKNGSRDVADIDDRHPKVLLEKAQKLQERGLFQDAINAYTESLAVDAKSPVALVNRAICHRELCHPWLAWDDATHALYLMGLTDALNQPADASHACTKRNTSKVKEKHRDFVIQALKIRIDILSKSEESETQTRVRADCKLGEAFDPVVFQEWGRLLEGPNPSILLKMGNEAYDAKNYERALTAFTDLTAHLFARPVERARAFAKQASILVKVGQFSAALESCNRSLEIRHRDCSSDNVLLRMLADSILGTQQSRKEDGPRLQQVIFRRASTYQYLGRYGEAEADYDLALYMAERLKKQTRATEAKDAKARLTLLRLRQTTGAPP